MPSSKPKATKVPVRLTSLNRTSSLHTRPRKQDLPWCKVRKSMDLGLVNEEAGKRRLQQYSESREDESYFRGPSREVTLLDYGIC